MSRLVEDLRAWWLGQPGLFALIGQRLHYLHPPQGYDGPYQWFARIGSGDDADRCLDDTPGQAYDFRELVDVEGIARDEPQAEAIALELRKLDSWSTWSGPVGTGRVQAVFVRDHTDEYVPHGLAGDAGLAVAALRFEIVGYMPGS